MRRYWLWRILLAFYAVVFLGAWVYFTDPKVVFARECSAEQARQTFGGVCYMPLEEDACAFDNEASCDENNCTGAAYNPHDICMTNCKNTAHDDAIAYCNGQWQGEYPSKSFCITYLTEIYSSHCSTDCFGVTNKWFKACEGEINEAIVINIDDGSKTADEAESTEEEYSTAEGYCEYHIECSNVCTSDDGGVTFKCKNGDSSWPTDWVTFIDGSLPRPCPPLSE